MQKVKSVLNSTIIIVLLLFFQACGNVSVNKDDSILSEPTEGVGPVVGANAAPKACERSAAFTAVIADITIPSTKLLYNNYFTRTHILGEDLFILADYSYGDQIIPNQPPTGATGVVEAKYFSNSSGVVPVVLPNISGYTWNSQAGTAAAWCYVGDSISNHKSDVYVLFYCASSTASPGFTNHIYKFSKSSRQFSPLHVSNTFIHGLSLNKSDELMFIENAPAVPGISFVYQPKKISLTGVLQNIGSQINSNQLQEHMPLRPGLFETKSGSLAILTRNNNVYGRYDMASKNFSILNWSQSVSFISQSYDSKELFYVNLTAGTTSSSKIFQINSADYSEMLNFQDGHYAYSFQALTKNVYTKAGYDRSVSEYKTWISYDNAKNFNAVHGLKTQTNQTVLTNENNFYSVVVDQYSNGKIKTNLYKLNCIE